MHSLTLRIYYEDTDAGGVVYYANYLKYYERARTEFLRALQVNQHTLATEHDALFVVRHAAIDYLRPARLDDLLEVKTEIAELKRATICFRQRLLRSENGECLSEALVKVCCISGSSFSPREIPDFIREKFLKD